MNVSTNDNAEATLSLGEVFDFKKVDEFRSAYEGIDADSIRTLKINFSETKYMDSSALGMLLNIQGHFKDKNVKIRIVNTKDQIKKILSISRFDQRFDID